MYDKEWFLTLLVCMKIPAFPAQLAVDYLFSIIYSSLLCYNLLDHQFERFISGCSIVFHWSIYLFLCQHYAILITVALGTIQSLEGLCFQLHFCPLVDWILAILDLLFHINFRIICYVCEKHHGWFRIFKICRLFLIKRAILAILILLHLYQKYICPQMFTAALFTVIETWKQHKCHSTDGWMKMYIF